MTFDPHDPTFWPRLQAFWEARATDPNQPEGERLRSEDEAWTCQDWRQRLLPKLMRLPSRLGSDP